MQVDYHSLMQVDYHSLMQVDYHSFLSLSVRDLRELGVCDEEEQLKLLELIELLNKGEGVSLSVVLTAKIVHSQSLHSPQAIKPTNADAPGGQISLVGRMSA